VVFFRTGLVNSFGPVQIIGILIQIASNVGIVVYSHYNEKEKTTLTCKIHD